MPRKPTITEAKAILKPLYAQRDGPGITDQDLINIAAEIIRLNDDIRLVAIDPVGSGLGLNRCEYRYAPLTQKRN